MVSEGAPPLAEAVIEQDGSANLRSTREVMIYA